MRRLVPEPCTEIDPYDAYADQPATWLRLGMVASVDGSVTDEHGRSGGLGGEPDLLAFHALRALCDAVLVGAATARLEGYRPYHSSGPGRERRAAAGKPAAVPIVVVSRSLRVDWAHELYAAPAPTIVVTCAAAATDHPPPPGTQMVVAGGDDVDLGDAVRQLRDRLGLRRLLCEGGPRLATSLIDRGLVDELCLTLDPSLLGARHRTPPVDTLDRRVGLTLTGLYEDAGTLLARYRPAA